jgi:dolichyl-phosphate-mannose-protein mannosyltransferase
MATAARTTGADAQTDELRLRKNVAPQSQIPVVAEAPVKEKSKEKVCTSFCPRHSSFPPACSCNDQVLELTTQQPFDVISFLDEYEFIWAPLIFTALAFFTRMWKIGLSPIVTWDEAQ